jgi:hypothetical protein
MSVNLPIPEIEPAMDESCAEMSASPGEVPEWDLVPVNAALRPELTPLWPVLPDPRTSFPERK